MDIVLTRERPIRSPIGRGKGRRKGVSHAVQQVPRVNAFFQLAVK